MKRTMKTMRTLALTVSAVLAFELPVSAYIDLGNGYVELEYGDSYGSIGAAYDVNYYNLGYYNGVDPDEVVVYPGDVIQIGYSSADEYYYGETSYNDYYGSDYYDYGYSNNNYYDNYYDYSYDYSYDTNYQYGYDYGYTDTSDYGITYGFEYYTTDEYGNDIAYEYGYTENHFNSYDNAVSYEVKPAASIEVYDTVSVPEYTEVQQVSYADQIGSASYAIGYTGNAAVNVSRACELNNDIIIPAGGTYRASDYIGSGSYDKGFVDAPGLMSDGSRPMMPGSGICPVTTYIYQAGKDAGLTVVERNDHSGAACSYADAGEQAMYNYGSSDLVMVNPYDHDIKLSCSYDGVTLSAAFYE